MSEVENDDYLPVFNMVVNDLIVSENNLFDNMTCCWFTKAKDNKIQSRTPSKSQYSNAVYWFGFHFKDGIVSKKEKYKSVIGIHIMPYCITEDDVKKAVKSCPSSHRFNEQDNDFIDLDDSTFNIHKYPDPKKLRFQVVLVQKNGEGTNSKYGPGKNSKGNNIDFFADDTSHEQRLDCVKKDWYFPAIDSKDDTYCSIDEPLKLLGLLKKDLMKAFNALDLVKNEKME